MTGQLRHMLPVLISVLCSVAVSDRYCEKSVFAGPDETCSCVDSCDGPWGRPTFELWGQARSEKAIELRQKCHRTEFTKRYEKHKVRNRRQSTRTLALAWL